MHILHNRAGMGCPTLHLGTLHTMTDVKGTAQPPDAFDVTIAQRIRSLREALQISAANLDRRTGLCPGTIGRMERQEQRVYAAHLYLISSETGVGIHYFYGTDAENAALSTPAEQETQRLLQAYVHIKDPVTKRDVYELIKSIAEEFEAAPAPR